MNSLESYFEILWQQQKPDGLSDPVVQFRFAPPRKWKADFAFPDAKLLIELEGGVWSSGRHIRPQGYENDCEKYNAAAVLGYRVLRFTSKMLENDPLSCIEQVVKIITIS